MYAAEAEYLAAGGPGTVSFAPLVPFFASDVVLHQADGLPFGGSFLLAAKPEPFTGGTGAPVAPVALL